MLTDNDACQLVLAKLDYGEPFALQSCSLSERKDYWIIRGNSAAYVLHGDASRRYVGVNAYLVDVDSGLIEIVGSGHDVSEYLQDKYDLREADGRHYVLTANFPRSDKRAIVHLRQVLECSVQRARELADAGRPWLTGTRRDLQRAEELLRDRGVATAVKLVEQPLDARPLGGSVWFWDPIKTALRE
ncbi:hypothetical protein [Rhizobacter sp. Root1221]|uniref:hypothetical protein n=1 Tax=Rhizobacter sp. Root1221 TaxID=1736433 RepID=UPI0007135850|nr:hypothetical protein [Rhizobacter sp. Root1221]KQV78296.1 hypothetical protein ASC87_11915 [Rhizobacter sp. Root1221]